MKQTNFRPENFEECLKKEFSALKKTLSGSCSRGQVTGRTGSLKSYLKNVPEFDDENTAKRVDELISKICDYLENNAYLKLILGESPTKKIRGSIYPIKSPRTLPGSYGSKQ